MQYGRLRPPGSLECHSTQRSAIDQVRTGTFPANSLALNIICPQTCLRLTPEANTSSLRCPLRPSSHSSSLIPPDLLPRFQPPKRPKSIHFPIHDPRLRRHPRYTLRQCPCPTSNDVRLPRTGRPLPCHILSYMAQTETPELRRRSQHRSRSPSSSLQYLRTANCSCTFRRPSGYLAPR